MENQFVNEPIEKVPDINKSYYISPFTRSMGLTYLMKLVLCAKYSNEAINIINNIISNDPHEINKQNDKGWTVLMIACRNSNTYSSIEIVKLLLDQPNIDVNGKDKMGWAALMMACRYSNTDSNVEIVKLLLDQPYIDINKQRSADGFSALMMACMYSNTDSNIETVKLLLDQPNIDINKLDNSGWSILSIACKYCRSSSNIETVRLLLNQPNIDINQQNKNKWTVLMAHMFDGVHYDINVTRMLLDCPNIDLNKQDDDGRTALMWACAINNSDLNIETVELLLNQPNIDINRQTKNGQTVLTILFGNRGGNFNTKTLHLLLDQPHIYIDRNTFRTIIGRDVSYVESLMSRIFCPLNFDFDLVAEILKNHNSKYKFIYYCNLHTNIKKEILKDIQNQKEELYCKPGNIIALCSEISFKLKFKSETQVFEELDNKLKFLFDIKNEDNMIDKILFYL